MPDARKWRLYKVDAKDSKANQFAGLLMQDAHRIEMALQHPILGVEAQTLLAATKAQRKPKMGKRSARNWIFRYIVHPA